MNIAIVLSLLVFTPSPIETNATGSKKPASLRKLSQNSSHSIFFQSTIQSRFDWKLENFLLNLKLNWMWSMSVYWVCIDSYYFSAGILSLLFFPYLVADALKWNHIELEWIGGSQSFHPVCFSVFEISQFEISYYCNIMYRYVETWYVPRVIKLNMNENSFDQI